MQVVDGRGGVLEDTFGSPWPQVLENCPVLGSRTAVFFEWLEVCTWAEKIFSGPFFGDRRKNFFEDLFIIIFWRTLAFLSLVLGLEHSCPWPRECLSSQGLFLASRFMSSTPHLVNGNLIVMFRLLRTSC